MQEDLFPEIVRNIGEYLETDVSHLKPESRLATSIAGIDSMKLFEMLLYLEDQFSVEFEDDVMENIETMKDLVDYIGERIAEKTASVAS